MAATLDELTTAVAQERTVEKSLVTLVEQLTGLIGANKNDPDAIQKILDDVNGQTAEMSAALVANTPAAPPSA